MVDLKVCMERLSILSRTLPTVCLTLTRGKNGRLEGVYGEAINT